MKWDDYKYFLALARRGSASAAGEEFGVSHTTVIRRISALEHGFGQKLFRRTSNGFSLTPEAEVLVPLAEQLEAAAIAIDRGAFQLDQPPTEIRLTLPEAVFENLLIDDIISFQNDYPDTKLRVRLSDNVFSIQNREADIAVRMSASPDDNLVGRNLGPSCYAIYGHQDAADDAPWVLWQFEEAIPKRLEKLIPGRKIGLHLDTIASKSQVLCRGGGIAELPCFIGDRQTDLVRLSPPKAATGWDFWVLTHEDLAKTQRIRTLLDCLYSAIENKRALITGDP